jgi:hypothetical protein
MFTSILDSGIFQVLSILLLFTVVGFVAYLIRKHVYHLPWEDKKVDPTQALKEEIERVLVPLEEPLIEKDVELKKPSLTSTPVVKAKKESVTPSIKPDVKKVATKKKTNGTTKKTTR